VIETSVAQTQTIEECEVLAYVRGFEERTMLLLIHAAPLPGNPQRPSGRLANPTGS
jgi:hypothetical protein